MENSKRISQFVLLLCGFLGFSLLEAVAPSPRLQKCCSIKTLGTQETDEQWQALGCEAMGEHICDFPKTYPGGPKY